MYLSSDELSNLNVKEADRRKSNLSNEIQTNLNKLEKLKNNPDSMLPRSLLPLTDEQKKAKIESLKSQYVENTLEKNVEKLIYQYYTHYKNSDTKATLSFAFSIIAMVIGLLFALSFIPIIFAESSKDQNFATSVAALSIVSELIAGLFFVFHKTLLEQSTFYFEKLENMNQTALAITLIDSITNSETKSSLLAEMTKKLITKSNDMT